MIRLLVSAILVLLSVTSARALEIVSPIEADVCGVAGDFVLGYAVGTGLRVCGTPTPTPPGGLTGSIQWNNAGAFAGLSGTGLVLDQGASAPVIYSGTSGAAHQWITALNSSGVGTFVRPACADLSDAGAGCTGSGITSPGGTTGNIQYNNAGAFDGLSGTGLVLDQGASAPVIYGGTSGAAHQWIAALNASGAGTFTQPACADLSDAGAACNLGGTITLNAGASVGLTAPGAMSLGGTYAFGATTDQPQFAGLGLGGAAAGANRLDIYGSTSGHIGIKGPAASGNNLITLPAGTTDFSTTGGASQFVKQAGLGAALTVVRPACADLSDSGAGCSGPAAVTPEYLLAIGWPATVDPNKNVIANIRSASTVTAIVGVVDTVVGAAATVSVYKASSGTSCAGGTVLHSSSLNANTGANTNQILTVTTSSLSAGDRLCLVTTGGANWTTGTGIGGITVFITTP